MLRQRCELSPVKKGGGGGGGGGEVIYFICSDINVVISRIYLSRNWRSIRWVSNYNFL